ncbi:UNVERIFIED_CONTAM: hypothetical protein K2H54_053309 [Gekko kuhli]
MQEEQRRIQEEQWKHNLEMMCLQAKQNRKIKVTTNNFGSYKEEGPYKDPSIYLATFEKAAIQWGIVEAEYMSCLCNKLKATLDGPHVAVDRLDDVTYAFAMERLVDNLLSGMSEFAVAYIDDIAIFSKDVDSHIEDLAKVPGAIQGQTPFHYSSENPYQTRWLEPLPVRLLLSS